MTEAALAMMALTLGLMTGLVIYQYGFDAGRQHELALLHVPMEYWQLETQP